MAARGARYLFHSNAVSSGILKIQNELPSNETIGLFANEGRLLWSKQFSPGEQSVNVSLLAAGVHFLKEMTISRNWQYSKLVNIHFH